MSLTSKLRETFGVEAEHPIRNNLLLIGAAALISAGGFAESGEAAYPFEALAVIAVAGPAAGRLGAVHGDIAASRSSQE